MRIGGLDVGSKTIGVALSDPMGWTAQALEVIKRNGWTHDFARLKAIAGQHQVECWVVGMPRNMNGSYGPQSEMVREFMVQLEANLGLPVTEWDERLSTMAAQRTLVEADVSRTKRRGLIDKLAAAVILQGYLDANARKS